MANGERTVQYLNSVAFPITKIAGTAASTLSSSVYFPFEQAGGQRNTVSRSFGDSNLYPQFSGWLNAWGNFGAAKVVLRATDKTKVVSDSIVAKIYVSFDKGASYQLQGSYTMPAAAVPGTNVANPKLVTIPYAPRLYVTATLNSNQALVAGHGLSVDIEFEEYMTELDRTVTAVTWADTKTGWTTAGVTNLSPDTKGYADSSWVRFSNTITISQYARPQRVAVVGWNPDASKIGADGVRTMWLQSSLDGTNWYNADTLYLCKPINGAANLIFLGAEEVKSVPQYTLSPVVGATNKDPGVARQGVLSKYLRLQLGSATSTLFPATVGKYSSALLYTPTTGPRFWVIAYY